MIVSLSGETQADLQTDGKNIRNVKQFSIKSFMSINCNEVNSVQHSVVCRHGLAIGSTGTFPGGLAADLARCPVFFIIIIIII